VAVDAESAVRYIVSSSDSTLAVDARTTLHAVHATVSDLSGYVAVAWNADGTLASVPAPKMHVEFPINRLQSGNGLQDREMQKLIDAKRFPKAVADLREVQSPLQSRYKATGDVTLAGRSRAYDGDFAIAGDAEQVTVDGELTLDIRDFGLKPPSLFVLKVDPVLRVRLRLVARKAE
jgi:polyisoprenoid-binding protein YceI